jgi:hypothetical protein
MALTVEDGTGKTDADSYVSLVDANTYDTAHGADAGWGAAADAAKEEGLRKATQYLDLAYSWRGSRTNSDQALMWPRRWLWFDGFRLAETAMPQQLKDATVELAIQHVNDTTVLFPVASTERGVKSERKKLGTLEKEVEYLGTKPTAKAFPIVSALIRQFIFTGAEVVRG